MTSRAYQRDQADQRDAKPGKTRRRTRVDPRVMVRCGCWLEHDAATVYGNTVDLGRGGLFLRTALPMSPGVAVKVTLHLPEHGAVEAVGEVVRRVAPSEAERPGLGVRFDQLTRGREALTAFLGVAPDVDDPLSTSAVHETGTLGHDAGTSDGIAS